MIIHDNQLKGIIAIFLCLATIPFIIFSYSSFFEYKIPFLANQIDKTITVEIIKNQENKGIFFVEPQTSGLTLLDSLGIQFPIECSFRLKDGMKLILSPLAKEKIKIDKIENSNRLALGMPIDINQATETDFLLISGIGEKTAQKILALKEKNGCFKNINDLMMIKGIKEKKLAKFREYLFVRKEKN
jgi:competence protein ComEA